MKLTIVLKGQALLNFTEALAVVGWADRGAPERRALANALISQGAEAVARAGWACFGPGVAMELRQWSEDDWRIHCALTGAELPAAIRNHKH